MDVGRSRLRRAIIRINQPAGGAAASAITVTGTVIPNGVIVETAWGAHPVNQPASGWGAATAVPATNGWTRTTTRPAAGTWFLHVRSVTSPSAGSVSSAVVVT